MAENLVQDGGILRVVAPYDLASGAGALVGGIFGVALTDADYDAGDEVELALGGVWTLPKPTDEAWTQGQMIFWDNTNKYCTTDATGAYRIGVATAAVDTAVATGNVRLDGKGVAGGTGGDVTPLTDSTGLSGTHDDTLAATTVPVDLTDNTGLSGTHDDTLAATAAPVTLTDSTGLSGAHDDTLAATSVMADLTGGESPTEAEFNTLLALIRIMAQNASDTAQKVIELVTLVGTMAQNDSDIAQKVKELRALEAVTTQNASDIGQKVNELVASA